MGGMLAVAGPVISGVSALGGLFGGKNKPQTGGDFVMPPVDLPPMWQMPGMNSAAGGALGGIEGMSGMDRTTSGMIRNMIPAYAQNVGQYFQGNPFISSGIQNVQNAASTAQNVGNAMIGQGNTLSGTGAGFLQTMNPILNTAFDPQNALYDRTRQQLQEQTRAGQAARGLEMSPYGAGLENKAMSDFNIDWQNSQLQRMLQGAQGAGGVLQSGQGAMMGGANLGQTGAGMLSSAAMMPYTAYNQVGSDNMGALDRLLNFGDTSTIAGMRVPQQQIQNYLAYLGVGNQANQVMNQAGQLGINKGMLGVEMGKLGLNKSNSMFGQNQILGGNLGTSLAGLGKAWKGWGGGGSSGGWDWSSPTTGDTGGGFW